MNEVMRSVVATKLKVAATVLLVPRRRRHRGGGPCWLCDEPARRRKGPLRFSGRAAAVNVQGPTPTRRPLIDPPPRSSRRSMRCFSLPGGPFRRWSSCKRGIRSPRRVDELRTAYPEEPRLTRYLPERWESLTFFRRKADILNEIRVAQRTAKAPAFKQEALLFKTSLKFLDTIDGRTAVTLAEALAQQTPRDRRTGELLRAAQAKLDDDWYLRAGMLASLLAIVSLMCCTVWARSALTWPRLSFAAGLGAYGSRPACVLVLQLPVSAL